MNQALETELIAQSFHVVIDGSMFDSLIEKWDRKLNSSGFSAGELQESSVLRAQYEVLADLLERAELPEAVNEIDRAIGETDLPTMVLTPDQRVMAINKEGRSHFQTDQGRFASWNWLKSEALAEYNAFAKSVNAGANKRYGIARITLSDQQESLIEFFPLDGKAGQNRNIVVRALKLIWIEQMDSMLNEAFGLTAAEIEVCRLLFEGKKTSEIAELRTTTKRTTGFQLSAIFAKTETDSQLNLVRLLARLASRSKVERITAPSDWSDPFEREKSFLDHDGNRLAYTWMGHPDGAPALLMHGAVNGYLYPPEFERALIARRIKLFALHRPGCGNSDRVSRLDLCDDIERAVRAFVAHVGLRSLPVIAICAAVIPAMRLSGMPGSPVSAILACGPFFPFTKARFSRMSGKPRTMVWAACNAPWISTVLARIGYRQVLKHGVDWYLEQSFELLPFDRQTAFDPEILPLLRNAAAFTFRNGGDALFEEWTMRNRDASLAAPEMTVPMHWLLGAVHIYNGLAGGEELDTQAEIDRFLALNPLMSFERIPDAGELMLYQKPEIIVERLAALMA